MTFWEKLEKTSRKNSSLLCVGLDPDLDKIPERFKKEQDPIFEFNKYIINQTQDFVCAYKPNIAFYEAYGIDGLKSLKKTIEYLRKNYSEVPIILDAKRGDIGNTAGRYAKALYGYWQADAATIYPHLGKDSILPYLKYKNKCTILLIKTSNPDSKVFQNLPINPSMKPHYLVMAEEIVKWNYPNLGFMVGATYPEELKEVRKLFPNSPILMPGLGAQSGQAEKAIKAGVDAKGMNLICNSSRDIIYSDNPRQKVISTRDLINRYRRNE
ncbi:MAG: orotidine-5'-phosphate decarboxylase [Patescibacteria group bacterium]